MLKKLVFGLIAFAALVSPLDVVEAATTGASTCTGGPIAAGTYQSLTVTGNCSLPSSGVVTVLGNLIVAPNAVLNALTPATLNVFGSITVGKGAIAVVGCSPAAGCNVTTTDRINGNVSADQPLAVIIHSAIIGGSVAVNGGGGGVNCNFNMALIGCDHGFPSPLFTDFEDNRIGGSLVVSNMQSCFFGVFRNHVGGTVSVTNNTFADPDATEIATNTISGNLACSGNSPAAQVGDSGGQPNIVRGRKTGECASL